LIAGANVIDIFGSEKEKWNFFKIMFLVFLVLPKRYFFMINYLKLQLYLS
jgi:hypothetical protein